MIIGKVAGTIVCAKKSFQTDIEKLLLIEKMNHQIQGKNEYIVALDLVGAGHDEIVLVVEGSPARETQVTANKPIDALIVGIIDIVDLNDEIVYKK